MIVKEKIGGLFFDLIKGDCLVEMQNIADGSIDCIICDLPYGTTACKWDVVIPFKPMWIELNRIIKNNGAIVLFGSEPFSSTLRISNMRNYKYDWVWNKVASSSGLHAKRQPLTTHELISVFYKKQCTYNPIMRTGKKWSRGGANRRNSSILTNGGKVMAKPISDESNLKYPNKIIEISNADRTNRTHPTQKPVSLMEYLINTYTNENETVLDFTMGSGSTGVACKNTNRNFIGIEKDENYFNIAVSRIKGTEPNPNNFEKVEERELFSFTDDTQKAN